MCLCDRTVMESIWGRYRHAFACFGDTFQENTTRLYLSEECVDCQIENQTKTSGGRHPTAKFDTNWVNLKNNLALQVHRRVRTSGRKSNAVACLPINVLLRQTGIIVTIYLATQYAPGPAAGSGAYWNLELLQNYNMRELCWVKNNSHINCIFMYQHRLVVGRVFCTIASQEEGHGFYSQLQGTSVLS